MGAMAQSPTAVPRVVQVAAVLAATFAVFAVWLLSGWGCPSTIRAVHVAGAVGFPSFAAVSTAVAARRSYGRQRHAWTLMTVSLVGLELSATAVVYHRFLRGNVHTVYPTSGMVGFLAFPSVACVAFLVFPAGYPGLARLRMMLDAAIGIKHSATRPSGGAKGLISPSPSIFFRRFSEMPTCPSASSMRWRGTSYRATR
jgi:hypothetical protein